MKKVLIFLFALVTVFAFNTTAFASGNITAVEYSRAGTANYGYVGNISSSEVTTAMSSGGELYATNSKAVALVNPDLFSHIDRVRCYPRNYSGSPIDLRIDPNLSSNWVGPGQPNGVKQVKTVQTILYDMGYLKSTTDIDGICGNKTIAAIVQFQIDHYVTIDNGIVDDETWRILCSAKYFHWGTSIWGTIS